jgi:hypothetical protein
MALRMAQKGSVVGIEMQGIRQWQRFIVQRIDICAEPPAGLARSMAMARAMVDRDETLAILPMAS